MKALILIILLIAPVVTEAQTRNEYSDKVVRFCKLHKGRNIYSGECSDLVVKILKKYDAVGFLRTTITDSTNSNLSKINVGDYLYFNRWKGQSDKTGSHYVVVTDIKDGKFSFAHQNVYYQGKRARGVLIWENQDLTTLSGSIEVYGLKSGKFEEYSGYSYKTKRNGEKTTQSVNRTPLRPK